jgi:PAS domain S-box-containing protein
MPRTTAQAIRSSPARPYDAYRVLFAQLSAGAARCRLIVERGRAVAIEVIDRNVAFDRLGVALPALLEVCAQAHATGTSESRPLRLASAVLAVVVHPVGGDEVVLTIEDATAHTQLAQRARESQARFEQAFHGNAAAMVIAHQRDLRIIDVNPRWLELFGATRDEVIGRTSVELGLITPSSAAARIAQHERFAEGHDAELELQTRAGAKLTVLASARPIVIPEGPCTLTTLIDITGRKVAEEAFAIVFSASPAGMMLVESATDTVVSVNQRLLEMTRARPEAYVGRRASDLALITKPPRAELLAELARSGRVRSVEVELACNGGPGVWTLASTELITLHDKPHRLSVFTDITVCKRFERRLVTLHVVGQRLAESSALEAAIPHVLEALGQGEGWDCGAVWLPDSEGALACHGTWRAPGVSEDLGLAIRELALASDGLLARVLATGTAEKTELTAARSAQAVPSMAAGLRCAVAFPILRGDAVLGVVALAAREADDALDTAELGLFDSVGRLLGLFVERARAEAALRELNLELERRVLERTHALETSNRDLEAFSASVSHDLRAPLRAIHGFSEILLEDFAQALPGEAQPLLARIHASAGRLRSLVEALLAFSRLGRDGLKRTDVDLDPLVRSVLDELLADRGLKGRLELHLRPLGSCHADPSLLRPVWTNLIDNALKYARNRDPIVIEIGREVRVGEVVYYVCDNGVGFDVAHASRLFGVFQRLHDASEFEGTGLGLANVRRIIECHHGRVAATSELDRGSRFEFTLGPENKT